MKVRNWILTFIVIFSFIGLIWYLGFYGFIISLLWNTLLLVLTNIDTVMSIIASSYKIFRKFSFWFERNAVEKRLEVTISSASKKVNEEVGSDLLPHPVDIKWAEPKDRDAFLEEGKVVVCLESSYNEERNLARATIFYVNRDLISESQRFINDTVMRSLCLAISRKILMLDKKIGALQCLNEEFIKPEIEKKPQIRKYVSGMDTMDKQGLLTRILLKEFSQLDVELPPVLTDPRARKETRAFTRHLIGFVEKQDEKYPLSFEGSVFRVHLLPVAKLDDTFNTMNFVKAASHCYSNNIDRIYVLARGMNVIVAKLIISEIEKTNLYFKNKDWEFEIYGIKKPKIKRYIAELRKVPPP